MVLQDCFGFEWLSINSQEIESGEGFVSDFETRDVQHKA